MECKQCVSAIMVGGDSLDQGNKSVIQCINFLVYSSTSSAPTPMCALPPWSWVYAKLCFAQHKAHLKGQEMCLDAVPGILLQLLH